MIAVRIKHTKRGFALIEFKDQYGAACSLQKSSLATADCVWLGVHGHRMHLTQAMVRRLILHLQQFAHTGDLDVPK